MDAPRNDITGTPPSRDPLNGQGDAIDHDSVVTFTYTRVLGGAAIVGVLTVLAKLAALGKDRLVARQLGAGDDLDAYLIAFLIPSFCAVVLSHSFASGFLPTYVRVWRKEGLAAAQLLFSRVAAHGLALLAIVTLGLLLSAGWLLPAVASDFAAEKLALSQSLYYPMVPLVVASGLSAMLAAVLNAHERFAAMAWGPVAIALVTLVVFWGFGQRQGAHALAWGTTLGFVAETILLIVATIRQGLWVWPRWGPLEGELKHVARQYLPVACGGLLMSGSLVVNQAMAANLGSGELSIFNYGGKVLTVVVGVVAVSLSTVLLPQFSQGIAAGRLDELEQTFRRYVLAIFLGSIPLVAILSWASEPIIALLFERGAFTPETTRAVSRVQLYLFPQIPFYVLAMLGARLLSALDGNHTVLRIGALNLLVNVVGNLILIQWLGVRGIALATTVVYVMATGVTLWAIRRKLDDRRAALLLNGNA